ncbi:MAG TPA: beta-L-arabinofuranosidase domain-containing protein, partial [Longimicrobiales bacterium]
MPDNLNDPALSRRALLGHLGKAAVMSMVLPPLLHDAAFADEAGVAAPLNALAGPDRIVVLPGKTYLNAWAGYGERPRPRRRNEPAAAPPPTGPAPTLTWSKESGPGSVEFADAHSLVTTATFSAPGAYVLKLTAATAESQTASTFNVQVERPAPLPHIDVVETRRYQINSRLWNQKARALIVSWIPHCAAQLNRTDLEIGSGGIDNFIEAGKALRGEPHGPHKGYVFSNAYVHNAVESMCVALLVDPQGDAEIMAAQANMRRTLEDWIPKILAAQHPDGYLQTAFTLRNPMRWAQRWTAQGRGNHEGYVAGYFIEAGIAHHIMTGGTDTRLYEAARKLADCWDAHIGPSPKQEWFDGHQEMEQALVRLGRYVNEQEGHHAGDKYIRLARFLLDCRRGGSEYDQSHLPVVQQYEAVGHAVRAA